MDTIRHQRGTTTRTWMIRVALIALALAPITWISREVVSSREAARRSQCIGVLSQMGLALANYESVYGTLPPAAVPGPDGTPWHSWRVLILPYLEQQNLHQSYRFDESWNGPHNRLLIDQMPMIFTCPTDQARQGGTTRFTSVVAVVGSGTCFPPDRRANTEEFEGVRDRTVLLVELADSQIPWTAPVDLDRETFLAQMARGDGSPHPGRRNVRFADYRVRSLPLPLDAAELRKLAPPPPANPEGSSDAGSIEPKEPDEEFPDSGSPRLQHHPGVKRPEDDHPDECRP